MNIKIRGLVLGILVSLFFCNYMVFVHAVSGTCPGCGGCYDTTHCNVWGLDGTDPTTGQPSYSCKHQGAGCDSGLVCIGDINTGSCDCSNACDNTCPPGCTGDKDLASDGTCTKGCCGNHHLDPGESRLNCPADAGGLASNEMVAELYYPDGTYTGISCSDYSSCSFSCYNTDGSLKTECYQSGDYIVQVFVNHGLSRYDCGGTPPISQICGGIDYGSGSPPYCCGGAYGVDYTNLYNLKVKIYSFDESQTSCEAGKNSIPFAWNAGASALRDYPFSAAYSIVGSCCGDDPGTDGGTGNSDCARQNEGSDSLICYMSSAVSNGSDITDGTRNSSYYSASTNLGDILYVGCDNTEYLAMGSYWKACNSSSGEWWENQTVVRTNEYMCNGSLGFWAIKECAGEGITVSGKDYGAASNALTSGGEWKQAGQRVDMSGMPYYCMFYSDWTTNLDEGYLGNSFGNDTSGYSCRNATLADGVTKAGFIPTATLCCGDDKDNDTYSDPPPPPPHAPNQIKYACYHGKIMYDNGHTLKNTTIIPNVYNYGGNLYGCNYSEPGITEPIVGARTGVSAVNYCANYTNGNHFCSYNGTWGEGGNRNTPTTWPYGLAVPSGGLRTECCAADSCWNGLECVSNQADSCLSPPSSGYRCINGTWEPAVIKTTPDGNSGFCSYNTQCLLFTTLPCCIDSGTYVNDYYCDNGNLTTRTKLLALKMLDIVQDPANDDYSIFCGNYTDVLNYYGYTMDYFKQALIGKPVADYLSGADLNKFCILNYNTNTIIGATINQDINSTQDHFLEALEKDAAYCGSSFNADGNYHACSKNDIWYNSGLKNVIYSKSSITFLNNASASIFSSFIKTPLSSVISWTNASIHNKPYDYSLINDLRFFDRLYINQANTASGVKKITAVLEKPNQNPSLNNKELILLQYKGFNSTDICPTIHEYSAKQNTEGTGVYHPRINCTKSGDIYTVTRDFSDVMINFKLWKAGEIWKDLTSKIRIK